MCQLIGCPINSNDVVQILNVIYYLLFINNKLISISITDNNDFFHNYTCKKFESYCEIICIDVVKREMCGGEGGEREREGGKGRESKRGERERSRMRIR